MEKDLVICHTPLQIEIVYSLIKSGVIKKFDLVLIGNKTEQFEYYFNKINQLSDKYCFIQQPKRFIYPIIATKLLVKFGFKKYKTIFFANAEKFYIHALLSNCKFDEIQTFDDGTANIVYDSMLYQVNKQKISQKIVSFVLRNKFNKSEVIELSSTHYTLYIDKKNIISNTKEVKLCLPDVHSKGTGHANVLLGSVYSYISTEPNKLIELINNLFPDKFYYIPHPRDNKNYFDHSVLIDGVNIAEVKILNLLSKYETVTIYGFNSTAQLNLNNNKRINNKSFAGDMLDINKLDLGLNEVNLNG